MNITRTTDYELVARLNKPIHDLHTNLHPKYFKNYDFNEIQDSFKRLITNEDFIFLLLEDNNEPKGYAWVEKRIYPDNAFKKQYKSVYVHQISIVEEQKRRGYGSHLMDHIYKIAKIEGIDLVELDYWFENENAKSFYKEQGFLSYREFVYKEL